MSKVYRHMSSDNLRELRSKKIVRLQKCEGFCDGFFNKREIDFLNQTIHQIDVELTARFLQLELL